MKSWLYEGTSHVQTTAKSKSKVEAISLLGQCPDLQGYQIYILILKASYNAKPDSQGMEIAREAPMYRYGREGIDAYLGR